MRAAAFLVGVALLAGCHHRETVRRVETAPAPGPTCLVSRGCEPPKPLGRCPAEVVATPVATVVGHRELAGRLVTTRGVLGKSGGPCTALQCAGGAGERVCCNQCGGGLLVGASEAALRETDPLRRQHTLLMLAGPGLACKGDESLLCCAVDVHGQAVIARGTLEVHGDDVVLVAARLCVP